MLISIPFLFSIVRTVDTLSIIMAAEYLDQYGLLKLLVVVVTIIPRDQSFSASSVLSSLGFIGLKR